MCKGKTTRIPTSTNPLVCLSPDYSSLARLAGKNTSARLRTGQWNAADGDFQVILYLLLDFASAIPVREREATVNFRFRRVFGCKEIVKLFLALNRSRIGIAKRQGTLVNILLDRPKNFRRTGYKFSHAISSTSLISHLRSVVVRKENGSGIWKIGLIVSDWHRKSDDAPW